MASSTKDITEHGVRQGEMVRQVGELKTCITRKRASLGIDGWYLFADGTPLSLATAPGYIINDNGRVIEWATGEEAVIAKEIKLPGSYDEAVDELDLVLKMLKQGATDDITVTVQVFVMPPATALGRGADLAPTAQTTGAAAFTGTDLPGLLTYLLDGNTLLANSLLTICINPETHATDSIELWDGDLVMRHACETKSIQHDDNPGDVG